MCVLVGMDRSVIYLLGEDGGWWGDMGKGKIWGKCKCKCTLKIPRLFHSLLIFSK